MISWFCALLFLITNIQPSYAYSELKYHQCTISCEDTNPLESDSQDFLIIEVPEAKLIESGDNGDDSLYIPTQHRDTHTIIRAPPVL
jgi:hypothetical protein